MNPPLVIVAYALAPGPGRAEAQVNRALVDELQRAGWPVTVLAGPGEGATDPAIERIATPSTVLTRGLDRPVTRPSGGWARLVDRVGSLTGRPPLADDAWSDAAAERLAHLLLHGPEATTVWARATPPESFEAAIRVHRHHPFPLVANYNDPMPRATSAPALSTTERARHDQQVRQNEYLAAHADAFTFPSDALARLMAERAELDPDRCFVIPHLTGAGPAADRPADRDGPPRLLYAGTPYGWVLDAGVGDALAEAQADGRIRLVLALRGGGEAAVERFRTALPTAELHTDLGADELDALVDTCDALLLVDDQTPLLRTKVAEGVQRLRPLISIAPAASTTTLVVEAAGGVAATGRDRAAVTAALDELLARLADPAALERMRRAQEALAAEWSPARVLARIRTVMDVATAHHHGT